MDYLLLRSTDGPDDAGTLRKLWRLLPKDAIVELKSTGRPYRSRTLDRLCSYLHLYFADGKRSPPRHPVLGDVAG